MSVLIDNMPIPLDFKFQLQQFLVDRLPPEQLLFARCADRRPINPLVCGNVDDYFTPPYPPLPPISIGEYQCPTGFSRYGRGLFVVDWFVLGKIAQKCWGWASNDPPEDFDIPDDWVTNSPNVYSLSLKFGGQDGLVYHVSQLFPLTPYRIPGYGTGLWLLPLVDRRYFMRQVHQSTSDKPDSWSDYFDSLATELGITSEFSSDFIDSASDYAKPDRRLYETEVPQESAVLLDIAALSVGLRPIYDPVENKFRLNSFINAKQTRAIRLADPRLAEPDQNSPTSPLLIAGGRRGSGVYPEKVKIWCKKSGQQVAKEALIPGGGIKFTAPSIWTSFESDDQAKIDAFATRVAADLHGWSDSGGQYCFAGVVVKPSSEEATTPNICGFDDFLSIRISESAVNGQPLLTTRIYELPAMLTPNVILVGGKTTSCGSALKYFVLAEDADGALPIYAWPGVLNEETGAIDVDPDATEPFEFYHWLDILSSPKVARAGYAGIYSIDEEGRSVFVNGPCSNSCETEASIDDSDWPDGEVDTPYDHTVPISGLNEDGISAIDLPDGLAIDPETGAVSGTPTESGTFLITLTGSSDDSPPCPLTHIIELVIWPEGEVPSPDPEEPPPEP